MSADNWVICPRCKVEAAVVRAEAFLQASEAYGKVPSSEYDGMIASAREPINLETTLREDYEFCLSEEGEFYASFEANCSKCAFSFAFKHEEQVPVTPES